MRGLLPAGKPQESAISRLNNQSILRTYLLHFIQHFSCFVPFHQLYKEIKKAHCQMGDVHCLLVMILVLYFPLRVKTGALKNGDISSDVTTKKTDPFKAVDMINLFR